MALATVRIALRFITRVGNTSIDPCALDAGSDRRAEVAHAAGDPVVFVPLEEDEPVIERIIGARKGEPEMVGQQHRDEIRGRQRLRLQRVRHHDFPSIEAEHPCVRPASRGIPARDGAFVLDVPHPGEAHTPAVPDTRITPAAPDARTPGDPAEPSTVAARDEPEPVLLRRG